jgi:hypothetical protein
MDRHQHATEELVRRATRLAIRGPGAVETYVLEKLQKMEGESV